MDRGVIYSFLTDRPDNRRPLTWERNQVEILMMEGNIFNCPWTGKALKQTNYDLDHILPVSIYPINEMWNSVPSDRTFNQHTKRDRLPDFDSSRYATPHLTRTYQLYNSTNSLSHVLQQDALARFDGKKYPLNVYQKHWLPV